MSSEATDAGPDANRARRLRSGGLAPLRALRAPEFYLGALGIAGFFVLWELYARIRDIPVILLPPPTRVLGTLHAEVASGTVIEDILVSAGEYVVGFSAALMVGVVLGLAAGYWRTFGDLLSPYVWFMYSIPLISLYPLIMLWFGLGVQTVVFLVFLLCVVPVTIASQEAVASVKVEWVQALRVAGGGDWDVLRRVVLPASLPSIMAGVRIASGRALTGVVIGEMFGANAGLGYRILAYSGRVQISEVFAYLFVILVLGVIVTQLVRLVETRLIPWRAR